MVTVNLCCELISFDIKKAQILLHILMYYKLSITIYVILKCLAQLGQFIRSH